MIVDPADYPHALAELERPGGPSPEFRFDLARKAFAHTAAYDTAIAATLGEFSGCTTDSRARSSPQSRPHGSSLTLRKIKELRYGENPHQPAAWYAVDHGFGLGAAQVLQGKELSFTNLLDLDSAARIALEFTEPAAAVIKHTNPCGAAIGRSLDEAYVRAREADPLAAFGGIIGSESCRSTPRRRERSCRRSSRRSLRPASRRTRGPFLRPRRTCGSSWPI